MRWECRAAHHLARSSRNECLFASSMSEGTDALRAEGAGVGQHSGTLATQVRIM